MMRYRLVACLSILAAVAVASVVPARLAAQQPVQNASAQAATASDDSIAAFAKTHLAVSALRDRYQAQFAEPQNKKREVQDALHEKFHEALQAMLKEHGYSEASFERMTRLVSVDSTARRVFEAALAREGKP